MIYWSEGKDWIRFKIEGVVEYLGEGKWKVDGKEVMIEMKCLVKNYRELKNGRVYEWIGEKTVFEYWKKIQSNVKLEVDWDNYMEEDLENELYKFVEF